MGCNCGGGGASRPGAQGYVLIYPDGQKENFATDSEARVANRKIGGKGLIRPVR